MNLTLNQRVVGSNRYITHHYPLDISRVSEIAGVPFHPVFHVFFDFAGVNSRSLGLVKSWRELSVAASHNGPTLSDHNRRSSIYRLAESQSLKNIDDLISAMKRMHSTYNAGRIERETVREFVLGLGSYPEPHGKVLSDAKLWFKARHDLEPDEEKVRDLDWLRDVAEGARTANLTRLED